MELKETVVHYSTQIDALKCVQKTRKTMSQPTRLEFKEQNGGGRGGASRGEATFYEEPSASLPAATPSTVIPRLHSDVAASFINQLEFAQR